MGIVAFRSAKERLSAGPNNTTGSLTIGFTNQAIPLCEGIAPLKIVPGAALRLWDGPAPLPPRVYDFYTDIGWQPRPLEWLFIDLNLTPGFYSDLDNTGQGAFRPRGQGLAIVALSGKFQFVAGVVYTRVRGKKSGPMVCQNLGVTKPPPIG